MADQTVHYNVEKWIEENEKFFIPPVCNKMMHNTQLKVFYVGGPNQRKDYHLEEGEELFFMRKGNMCLKILENGKFKDVHIKQGEVFLLPGKIPHSPQRDADTIGLVIERERLKTETDGLRYYVEGTTESLYEKWFYCEDLGSQLGPIIKGFFASEQYRTGKPIPEELPKEVPWVPDNRIVESPFDLMSWVDSHAHELKREGSCPLFDPKLYQSDVSIHGYGACGRDLSQLASNGDAFIWVLRGNATFQVNSKTMVVHAEDTILVPMGSNLKVGNVSENAAILSTVMDPNNRSRVGF